jgi:signal transduction histidine kinase
MHSSVFSLHHYIERHHGLKPDAQRYQSVYMILSLLLIMAALFAAFAVLNISVLARYQLHGVWTWPAMLLGAHLMCLGVLADFHLYRNGNRTALSAVLLCAGVLVVYLWLHGRNYGAPMFYFVIPAIAFILLGSRRGAVVSLLVLLAVVVVVEFTLAPQPMNDDNALVVFDFICVGLLLTLMTYFYESSRQFAIAAAEAKNREIEAANSHLSARNQEQDRFMAMLSHELKTPLSVIRMALGSREVMSVSTQSHVQQAVHDMDALVERCLQADRLQHHRHVGSLQPFRLDQLLAELKTACQAPQRLCIDAPCAPAEVIADLPLLRIALGNLIDNAIKYAAPSSMVHMAVTPEPHNGNAGFMVAISNAPSDAGMPDPQHVFTKYYRSPGAHSKTGSGLGLYLVHSVAQRLGGWVRYAPAENCVRFVLWVPAGLSA